MLFLFLFLTLCKPDLLTYIICHLSKERLSTFFCKAGLLETNYLHFCFSKKSLFCLHFGRIVQEFSVGGSSPQDLKYFTILSSCL